MKYIFFGTPEFATIILEKLIKADFIPEAVICNSDKPVGRKKIITFQPIKQSIKHQAPKVRNRIKIFQSEKLDLNIKNQILKIKPDFFIVAAYSNILPKEILEIPQLGTIGVHPSLLPKYRGPSPIQTTILNGDNETGTTLYLMNEGLDSGNIIANNKYQALGNDNYKSLMKKLAKLSADLLIKILPNFLNNEIAPQLQDKKQVTYTKKFQTKNGYIEFENLKKAQEKGGEIAIEIDRKIRALSPEPGIFTFKQICGKQKRVKLLEAKIINRKLKLIMIQFEGKKPMLWDKLT